jgi:hypothetical protein
MSDRFILRSTYFTIRKLLNMASIGPMLGLL